MFLLGQSATHRGQGHEGEQDRGAPPQQVPEALGGDAGLPARLVGFGVTGGLRLPQQLRGDALVAHLLISAAGWMWDEVAGVAVGNGDADAGSA
jgi:hypothetical protein